MRFLRSLALIALLPSAALALPSTSIPSKFPLCWAANAGSSYVRTIPVTSQIGITPGAASLNDGFPPLNFTPLSAGGVPPFGQDMNGIHQQETCGLQWSETGGGYPFDSSFSATIGGYPAGSIIPSSNRYGISWLSATENNTGNPDSGAANWFELLPINIYATDTGTANAMSINIFYGGTLGGGGVATLADFRGKYLVFQKAASANTGTATLTLKDNSYTIGTATLHHVDGTPLVSGDLASGATVGVVYDGTFFDLMTPPQATTLGTAASKNATNNADSTVSSVTGSITNTHVPLFADNFGSIKDNGNQLSNGSNTYLSTNPGSQTTNAVPLFADGNGSLKGSGALLTSSSSFVVTSGGSVTSGDIPKFTDTNGTIGDSTVKAGSVALDWISFNAPGGSLATLVRSSTSISIVRNSTGVFTITETGTHSNIIAIGQGSLNTSLNNSQLIMNANNSSCSTSCTIQIAFSQPSEGSTMTPTDPPTNAMVVIYGQ